MARFTRWEPDAVVVTVLKDRVGPAFTKFGLIVEADAKRELRKGHGVITGTLRRSIHLAEPGYNFQQDDVEPGDSSPERGKQAVSAQVTFGRVSLLLGSGVRYALAVHQGHHGFEGYHFLTLPLERDKSQLPGILAEFSR